MNPLFEQQLLTTRRQFFGDTGLRLGGLAMAMLAAQSPAARALASVAASSRGTAPSTSDRVHPPLPGYPHHQPRAKSIIYLHMNGGPSQMDLWDYKPSLREMFDKDLPKTVQG